MFAIEGSVDPLCFLARAKALLTDIPLQSHKQRPFWGVNIGITYELKGY